MSWLAHSWRQFRRDIQTAMTYPIWLFALLMLAGYVAFLVAVIFAMDEILL